MKTPAPSAPEGLFTDKDYLMIIQCDKCSTKFRLDDSRITGNGVRVRCTKCQHVFIVAPPPPAEEVGAEADVLEAGQDAYAAPKKVSPSARKSVDNNLKFDFGSSSGGDSAAQAPSGESDAGHSAPEAPASGNNPKSFDDIDYSFATDRSVERPSEAAAPEDGSLGTAAGGPQAEFTEEEPEANPGEPPGENPLDSSWSADYDLSGDTDGETSEVPSDWEIGAPGKGENALREDPSPAEEKPPFSDLDFGSGEKENKEEGPAPSVSDNGWSIDTGASDEKTAGTVPLNSPAEYGAGEQRAASAASSYGSDGRPVEAAATEQTPEENPVPETLKFSQYFSEEMLKEEEREEEAENAFIGEVEESGEEEEEETREVASGAGSGRALIIAALVFLVGGAVIYFSGVIDNLARRFAPPARVAAEKSVDIETVKGYYTENKNFGKFFVIEATIKNISAEPQAVKAVTGLLYDSKGVKIASRSVAPGRVVSAEDLGNLPKEDLLKPFKDPSGGTLPPKGTVPVMVPFIDPPAGISEYGIDIIR